MKKKHTHAFTKADFAEKKRLQWQQQQQQTEQAKKKQKKCGKN